MRRPDRNRASPAPPPRLCPRPARATSRPRPCCAAPDRPASRLRPTPRAPPAHLDSPDPALCPAPRAASQSSFSPSCPRLSRGRMFHVKHSSASDPPAFAAPPIPRLRGVSSRFPTRPLLWRRLSPIPSSLCASSPLSPIRHTCFFRILLLMPPPLSPPRSAPLPPPACAACSPCLRACVPRVDRRARFCYSGENTRRPSAPACVLRVGRAPPACAPPRPRPRRAAFPRRCHGFPERRLQRGL